MAGTLGSLLRQKRESLGLSLEKVEGLTHIRLKHLQAIESDDLSTIPSVTQARGFIRNYASFLGFHPDNIAALLSGSQLRPGAQGAEKTSPMPMPSASVPPAQPSAASSPPTQSTAPVGSTRPRTPVTAPVISRSPDYAKGRPVVSSSSRSWLRLDLILAAGITLVIVALLGWGGYQAVLSMTGPEALSSTEQFIPLSSEIAGTGSPFADHTALETVALSGSETPANETLESTPEMTALDSGITPNVVTIAAVSPTAFPTPLGGVYTDVRIHLVILQRAYLQVEVDGKEKFSGRVLPDETYDFIGSTTITVSTGNGAAVRVIFNGVDEGTMGRFGEVVSLTYTPTGLITPIPQPTATPSITPSPTRTTNP